MPIPLVIVFAVAVILLVVWSRLRLRTAMAQNQDKTLGAMAARMGLAVESGDPSLSILYFQQPARDYDRELRASGAPYGRPVKLTLMDGRKTTEYFVYRKITHSFGCFLEASAATNAPAFEVVLRQPNEYLVAPQDLAARPNMMEARTGDPALDARYLIRAADPRVGPALAPALRVLASQLYVHLAGEGTSLWMSFTRTALPYLSLAPEVYSHALEAAACGCEGRPAPAPRAWLAAA